MNTTDRQRREGRRGLPASAADRNRTLLRHIGLIHHVARQQSQRGPEDLDDLVQEAAIGAMAAVERFDPRRGHRPSSYISSLANGQILHFRRDRAGTMRVPWRMKDLISRGERLQASRMATGQPPLGWEALARELGVTDARWQQCQRVVRASRLVSLDQPRGNSSRESESQWIDAIAAEDPLKDPQLEWLRITLNRFDRQEQRLLLAYYVQGESLVSLAKRFKTDARKLRRRIRSTVCLLKQLAKPEPACDRQPWPSRRQDLSAVH